MIKIKIWIQRCGKNLIKLKITEMLPNGGGLLENSHFVELKLLAINQFCVPSYSMSPTKKEFLKKEFGIY